MHGSDKGALAVLLQIRNRASERCSGSEVGNGLCANVNDELVSMAGCRELATSTWETERRAETIVGRTNIIGYVYYRT